MSLARLLIICLLISFSFSAFANDAKTTELLVEQLNGQRCDYKFVGKCEKRDIGFLEGIGMSSIRNMKEQCISWSAQCLGSMRLPEAVPVLIGALKTQPNVQTCDGVIPLRYIIIEALVNIGDKRAIPPLEEYIKSDNYEKLSAGANGCAAQLESKQFAKEALDRISSD